MPCFMRKRNRPWRVALTVELWPQLVLFAVLLVQVCGRRLLMGRTVLAVLSCVLLDR